LFSIGDDIQSSSDLIHDRNGHRVLNDLLLVGTSEDIPVVHGMMQPGWKGVTSNDCRS
jgi:hypothetical protein